MAQAKQQDSVVRMLAWKAKHPSTEFDLSPHRSAATVPGHDDPFEARTLGWLMDRLEALDAANEPSQPGA